MLIDRIVRVRKRYSGPTRSMSMSKVTRFVAAIVCFRREVDRLIDGCVEGSGDRDTSRVNDGSVEGAEGECAPAP